MHKEAIQIALAFGASVFPAILFNIDRRKIGWAGLCGALGWLAYLIVYGRIASPIAASFVGALVIGVYSESMARRLKTPAFVFLIPGIFPLVPGFMAYTTLRFIVDNNISMAFDKGVQTLSVAGAIGFGIMLSTAIFKFMTKLRTRKKIKA